MKKYAKKLISRAIRCGLPKTAVLCAALAAAGVFSAPLIERGFSSLCNVISLNDSFSSIIIQSEFPMLSVTSNSSSNGTLLSNIDSLLKSSPAAGDDGSEINQTLNDTLNPPIESTVTQEDILSIENAKPIAAITIAPASAKGYSEANGIYIKNETHFDIDIAASLSKQIDLDLSGDGPHVLILHTHGSEAYSAQDKPFYTSDETNRSTDISQNVVAVGSKLAEVLTQKGIRVIHVEKMFDVPDYNSSYSNALEEISAQLKANPNIKVIIDVHRDAMVTQTGTKYKTISNINGKNAAQLMFVVGSSAGTLPHANWQQNLRLAIRLQDRLNAKYPGLARPINLRASRFNQHTSTGAMLVEIGTSGNTLDEAQYTAELFGDVLGDFLNTFK